MFVPAKQSLWSVTTPSRGKKNNCPGHHFNLGEHMDIVVDDYEEEQPNVCEANTVFPTINRAKLRDAVDNVTPDRACNTSYRNFALTEVKIQTANERKKRIMESDYVDDNPWSTIQFYDEAWETKITRYQSEIIPLGK